MQEKSPTPILVTDFDGTMTDVEFYRLALAHLVPPGTPDYFQQYLAGRMTHFEAIRRIFAAITADESEMLQALHMSKLDPALGDAVKRLQDHGWQIVIASAGCDWYIKRLLTEQGVDVPVIANPGEFIPGSGLLMRLPEGSPYYSASTGIDKVAVVQDMLQKHKVVAFAGDGRPDYPAAKLVPPNLRFARRWLADQFDSDGVEYQRFERWSEIADRLPGNV